MDDPSFIRNHKRVGRRAEGERYERRVHQEFYTRYPGYLASPWFRFVDQEGEKWCQPDGLLINPWRGHVVIVEAKYQHTELAYKQLFGVYLPVVSVLFGGLYKIACVEVVKWFDPAVLCSQSPQLCKEPDQAPIGRFNVHIWKPRVY